MGAQVVDVATWINLVATSSYNSNGTYIIADTAANIAKLPQNDLFQGQIVEIESTLGALILNETQALQILQPPTGDEYPYPPIHLVAPSGQPVILDADANFVLGLHQYSYDNFQDVLGYQGFDWIDVKDSASAIDALTVSGVDALAEMGVIGISADDGSISLSVAVANEIAKVALNAYVTGITSIGLSVPKGDIIAVRDTAAELQTLSTDEIAAFQAVGVTAFAVNDVVRPSFSLAQLDALDQGSIKLTEPLGIALPVSALISDEANPAGLAPGFAYNVIALPSDFENDVLSPSVIAAAPQQIVSILVGGSVDLTVAQAEALENASLPVIVPAKDTVTVVDSPGALEAMSTDQLEALAAIGVSGVESNSLPAIFTTAQMQALGNAGVAVVNNSLGETGGVPIPINDLERPGTGLTFFISWDASVASAPANFETDVLEAFQFYADTFTTQSPVTLYYDIGFGEAGGGSLGNGDLGFNHASQNTGIWSYSQLVSALGAAATSNAQQEAVASLPATDPTGGASLYISTAEEQALGLTMGVGSSSPSSPDDTLGLSATNPFDYSTNPDDVPSSSAYDFIGTVEHELSEGMGRYSILNEDNSGATSNFTPLDLFRFSSDGARALTGDATPSYFSINDGGTNLGDWNNYTTGNGGDLADWAGSNPYIPDSFNDNSDPGNFDPITASDVLLMNILGYQLASPVITPAAAQEIPVNGVAITVGQLLTDEAYDVTSFNPSGGLPTGDYYYIVDNAIDIENLDGEEIIGGKLLGLGGIISIDDSVVLNVDQIEGLENTNFLAFPTPVIVPVIVPSGDAVTLSDNLADIESMSAAQLAALPQVGVTSIDVTDTGLLTLSVDQAEALENPSGTPIRIVVPSGGEVVVQDSDSAIESMSALQISTLPSIGVSEIGSPTDATLILRIDQGVAIEDTGLVLFLPPFVEGGALQFADRAANIVQLADNPAVLIALSELASADGASILQSTDTSITLSVDQALAFVGTPFHLTAPGGVIVADTPSAIEGLSTTTIDQLAALGVTELQGKNAEFVTLSTAQFEELAKDGITIGTTPFSGFTVIEAKAAQIAQTFTPQVIDGLTSISPGGNGWVFESTDSPITFDVQQIQAIENAGDIHLSSPGFNGNFSLNNTLAVVADSAAQIETLTPVQISELDNFTTTVTITQGAEIDFNIQQALAFYATRFSDLTLYNEEPSGSIAATITDTAQDFEDASATELGELHDFVPLVGISLAGAEADGSLAFTAAQAQAIGTSISIGVPTGDTIAIVDNGAGIKALLDQGAAAIEPALELNNFGLLNAGLESQPERLSGIFTNDGSIALSVNEAEALEAANAAIGTSYAITAPGGTVTLSDDAASIEGMSAQQLSALPSIGVTAITVEDQSVTLMVAQALALYDPVPISVPPGDTVYVADTEQAIDGLTPTTLAELAAVGVQTIEVSNPTGAGPLTIDSGLTLAISGAVPANQTITFAGTGGTLSLSNDSAGTDVAGTIYGFSPPDTIDLTDVPYDPTGISEGISGAALGTDPTDNDQAIVVTENGNTYYLDLDPSQVFLTGETFTLQADSSGTGTDVTVTEPPITASFVSESYGQPVLPDDSGTADGVVLNQGGEVDVTAATVNRAIIQSTGELIGDAGSTITDTFIQSGGILQVIDPTAVIDRTTIGSGGLFDLTVAANAGGIHFGPTVDGVGGTLQIDFSGSPLEATLSGFAPGDTIDLTALGYDASGSVTPGTDPNTGGVPALVVSEDGNTFYIDFDSAQDFAGQTFHLSPDGTGASPGTDITESSAPCYCRGTLIKTGAGEEAVENLKIGDKVITMSGTARPIKWIGRRSYAGRFVTGRADILPICIRAGALDDNVPRRDLWISPRHAMYLDGVLIEAKDLVNGVSIVQAERVDKVEYFHIELDSHDVIVAEGALSESFIDDDSRGMFHNAGEYNTLYAVEHAAPAHYCASRLDEGYEVDAVRRRLAVRAGLLATADHRRSGPLRGHVDLIGPDRIIGWAQSAEHPEAPVCLDIYVGGRRIGQTLANRYRDDLKRAGIGSGWHCFEFAFPATAWLGAKEVKVCRTLDAAALPVSPDAKKMLLSQAV